MIDAKIDTAKAERHLRQVARKLTDRRTVNRQVAAQLQGWVFRNFKAEGGMTEGRKWAPLQQSTIDAKARLGYRMILQNTTSLKQSFLPFSDNDMAGVGAKHYKERPRPKGTKSKRPKRPAPWDLARIHQEGTEHIPARPMLPTMRQALPLGIQIYELHVAKAVKP